MSLRMFEVTVKVMTLETVQFGWLSQVVRLTSGLMWKELARYHKHLELQEQRTTVYFIKRLGKVTMTSWEFRVVVFKILEALVASRYLKKKKKSPNTKLQCVEATGCAENTAHAIQTPTLSPGETHSLSYEPQTGPCVQVLRRGLGQGMRP